MEYEQHSILAQQLPDLGANNRPPTIRRDSWKPFWVLQYPESEKGYAGGLEAFQKLREWRYLHEYTGKVDPEVSRRRTEEEIEELQDRLDNRGGSKKESVYDVIRRENKRVRARAIMDQEANSVADLAAVLLDQETSNAKLIEMQLTPKTWTMVLRLLPVADRGPALTRRYKSRLKELESMKQNPKSTSPKDPGYLSPGAIRARIHELKARLAAVVASQEDLKQVKDVLREMIQHSAAEKRKKLAACQSQLSKLQSELADEDAREKVKATRRQEKLTIAKAYEDEEKVVEWDSRKTTKYNERREGRLAAIEAARNAVTELEREIEEVDERQTGLPTALQAIDINDPTLGIKPKEGKANPEARRDAVRRLRRLIKPTTPLNGVEIWWQDTFHADYAQKWPDSVTHHSLRPQLAQEGNEAETDDQRHAREEADEMEAEALAEGAATDASEEKKSSWWSRKSN